MYLCGTGKHNCQPFCGPEGRFYCSDSVCSLWPAPFSYLCVSVMILWVCWKLCGWTSKNPIAAIRLLWSPLYWLRCLYLVLWPLHTITLIMNLTRKSTWKRYHEIVILRRSHRVGFNVASIIKMFGKRFITIPKLIYPTVALLLVATELKRKVSMKWFSPEPSWFRLTCVT